LIGEPLDERGTFASRPELRLWFHMLRRAVWDFAFHRNAEKGTEQAAWAMDAAGWIWWDGEEDLDEFHRPTFRYVCASLGLDPGAVRRAVLRLDPDDAARLNKIKDDEV
jgi:hypothetical protein